MGAGSSRHQTGSYVDTKSFNLLVGAATKIEFLSGNLIIGPFIEAGYTSYETHNDYSFGHVKGEGNAKYFGVGVLSKYEMSPLALGVPYIEGSLRMGHSRNKLKSNDLRAKYQTANPNAEYETKTAYYGAHAGLGFVWDIKDTIKLDTYAKYFYNHISSTSAVVRYDKFDFEAVNSHKTLIGARLSKEHKSSDDLRISAYIGAGWEYEFGGEAKAFVYGYGVDTPTLGGGSGRGELGLVFGKSGFTTDIGISGYTGLRKGLSANVAIKYEF